ncbi:hypothetical protein PV-S19_0049 [Pacmanvirus S19]|nr:hypothetical protein PV-S19_0049 [Pacmanvirus S19]
MPGNEPSREIFLQRANGYGEKGDLSWVASHWFTIEDVPKNFIGFKIKSSQLIEKVMVGINNKTVKITPNKYECCVFINNPEEFISGDINNVCIIIPESYWLTAPMEIWYICGEK